MQHTLKNLNYLNNILHKLRIFFRLNNILPKLNAITLGFIIPLIYFTTIGLHFNHCGFYISFLIFGVIYAIIFFIFATKSIKLDKNILYKTLDQEKMRRTLFAINLLTILALCLLKWIKTPFLKKLHDNNWIILGLLSLFFLIVFLIWFMIYNYDICRPLIQSK